MPINPFLFHLQKPDSRHPCSLVLVVPPPPLLSWRQHHSTWRWCHRAVPYDKLTGMRPWLIHVALFSYATTREKRNRRSYRIRAVIMILAYCFYKCAVTRLRWAYLSIGYFSARPTSFEGSSLEEFFCFIFSVCTKLASGGCLRRFIPHIGWRRI